MLVLILTKGQESNKIWQLLRCNVIINKKSCKKQTKTPIMITGIGIDIIDNQRIRSAQKKWGNKFLLKILSKEELKATNNSIEHLCGAIALKEAAIKALSKLSIKPLSFKDISVGKHKEVIPSVSINNRKLANIKTHASISHDGNFTTAIVVCEN